MKNCTLSHTLDENDILYVMGDGDRCRNNNHLLFSSLITLKLINGKSIQVKGQYCFTCHQVQISRNTCAQHREYHNLMLSKLFMKGIDDSLFDEEDYKGTQTERAEVSKLKMYGYTVSQNSRLTNAERQDKLRRLIVSKELSKGYIISYLQHMIQINGKKESNNIAVKKWKSDLEYVMKL